MGTQAITPPAVSAADTPADFDLIVARAQNSIAALKPLDYGSLYKELGELNIPTTDSPSLQKMEEEIQRI